MMNLSEKEKYLIRMLAKDEVAKTEKEIKYKEKNNDEKDLVELKDYYNNMLNIYLKFGKGE